MHPWWPIREQCKYVNIDQLLWKARWKMWIQPLLSKQPQLQMRCLSRSRLWRLLKLFCALSHLLISPTVWNTILISYLNTEWHTKWSYHWLMTHFCRNESCWAMLILHPVENWGVLLIDPLTHQHNPESQTHAHTSIHGGPGHQSL